MRFAYADPPYPGTAFRYYGDQPTFRGEVDHRHLVRLLEARREIGELDGWALSTSAKALRDVLPLCPAHARVCAWVKPTGASPATHGLHNAWEPLIVVGGRQRSPGKRDWLMAHAARSGGELPGRKPIAFCAWLFDCLGMVRGDELEDLYPGTGIVMRSWLELSSKASLDAFQAAASDASRRTSRDVSSPGTSDASSVAGRNASPAGVDDTSRDVASDASSSCSGDA